MREVEKWVCQFVIRSCLLQVNHFPCGFHLGRKDRLWQNYNKMLGRHGSEAFDFFPETFVLPADLKALRDAWGDKSSWIIKPVGVFDVTEPYLCRFTTILLINRISYFLMSVGVWIL